MKHAVLGSGAIGGLMATALGYTGEDVALIVRPEKVPGYPQILTLHQPERTITAAAPSPKSPDAIMLVIEVSVRCSVSEQSSTDSTTAV